MTLRHGESTAYLAAVSNSPYDDHFIFCTCGNQEALVITEADIGDWRGVCLQTDGMLVDEVFVIAPEINRSVASGCKQGFNIAAKYDWQH